MRILRSSLFLLSIFLYPSLPSFAQASAAGSYPIQPVLFTSVRLNDNFWAPRIKVNHDITIPFALQKCRETGRVKNFEIAAGLKTGNFCTEFTFDDSDVYKIIEGASYAMQISRDPKLEAQVDSLIALIGKAQEPDGYLYTNRTIMKDKAHEWAGSKRWEKEQDLSHELYNIGHLIEAAVAYYHATGKKDFLNIAVKAADRICDDIGPGKIQVYPGHQIIELAMAKLYMETGNKKYLDEGKFFLDVRGPGGEDYNQAHKKVADQHEAVGHAVRAAYMYAGMADIAALTHDASYLKAIDDIWKDAVTQKIYITGGIGSTGNGEAFGKPFELPNMSAYNETCASIANVYWNYRLFLLHGDAQYFDVLERTLYNAFLSGVSLSGDKFFYPNPLESHGQHSRSPWFACACCPSNVSRFIPSLGGYFYAQKHSALYVNLFAAGTASFKLPGNEVELEQVTNYPWDGDIVINVTPQKSTEFDVRVRIPGWSVGKPIPGDLYTFSDSNTQRPEFFVNDKPVPFELQQGYAVFTRKWKKGDRIHVKLPMSIRKIKANDQVEADKDKFAVQRGPLVYCAEWPDYQDGKVLNLLLAPAASLSGEFQNDFIKGLPSQASAGVYVVKGEGAAVARLNAAELKTEKTPLTLIPYFAWAYRGPGEMTVWLAAKASAAQPLPSPTIASTSKVSGSRKSKTLMSLNDQMVPKNSNDQSIVFYHWWPKKDTVQWLQYDFAKPATISSSSVYWFDDGPFGGCRIPAGWKLLYRKDDQWVPVNIKTPYEIKKDAISGVTFEPVQTSALRMEITLPKEHSSGVMEWSVE